MYNTALQDGLSSLRGPCTNKTREGVLYDLCSWAKALDSASIFCMTGMAGTGKTTIVYSFCKLMEEYKMLGASFFCSVQLPECRDYRKIIPTIAHQIAKASPSFCQKLVEVLPGELDLLPTDRFYDLFELLIAQPAGTAWKEIDRPPMVVVIDALDECDGSNLVLHTLLDFSNDSRLNGRLRFLINTRPEPQFMKLVNPFVLGHRNSELHLHDIEADIVEADIFHYLSEALQNLDIADHDKKVSMLAKK